jgi:hypothetical protein
MERAYKEIEKQLPKSIELYIFRHAKTEYEEDKYFQQTGKCPLEIKDVTEEGEEEVRRKVQAVIKELDPQKHVVVFLSSPRARAKTTASILEEEFSRNGFDTRLFGGETAIVNRLQTSSILKDEENTATLEQREILDAAVTGKPFKDFLSYFAAIDQIKLSEVSKRCFDHKIPIFIAVTHAEVIKGGATDSGFFPSSFLGKLFPESSNTKSLEESIGVRFTRGSYFKLSFDLEHPGEVIFQQVTKKGVTEQSFIYNQGNGEITPHNSG